jgi:KDO2-lipid IV(A) lauroyltransferase
MKIIMALLRCLSRLPLRCLYVIADMCYPLLYYVVRYRRQVVRQNLLTALPELSPRERRRVERRFYRWFCDYVVETLKLLTMSPAEMRRRLVVEGVEAVEDSLESHPFSFIFLGHYCNWEWISSLPLWTRHPSTHCAQLYRPLKSAASDALFYTLRTRFGSENISKYDALRRIVELKREGRPTIVGFISDQAPGWNSIHDWVDFLHHDTPVFTGTERIAKKVNAAVYFADVRRLRRGYYHLQLRLMTEQVADIADYRLTEQYMQWLEVMIRRQPHLWLWSHRRWKHRRNADGSRAD